MLYRKYGTDYEGIAERLSRSELTIHGADYNIDAYRLKRVTVKNQLTKMLRKRLNDELGANLLDLYIHELRFSKVVNDKNLVRELNTIYNEQARHVKDSAVINSETNLQVQRYKNQAKLIIKTAEYQANNTLVKIEEISAENLLEKAHLTGYNKSLENLGFSTIRNETERQQRTMSFCWVSTLLYHPRLNYINADGFKKDQFTTIFGSFDI